ncbi:PREDICTED: rab proteins geranylgeranyltransferase component A 2 [Brassica oleracea var. oleracea]|uniref:Rab escort protein 1 n=1 Tax=Brassica oleracea var. oleracea TaxID=109376 RepID=A0A0D3CMA8_BRAOL|nr:PREDICTED: rab proteins geranylgeranyltransferase component A 2 [Brassica oleracea var. oleracea]
MSDLPPYPPLDPTTYDLIIVGTGVPSSILAAAASSSGTSVLHLDPNPFYGSHFASLSLPDLTSFLRSNSLSPPPPPPSDNPDFLSVDLATRSLYSSVEIATFDSSILDERHSRKLNVDLCGPRVLFCADESINLMLRSGSNNYVEFKSVDASFVGDSSGELRSVPDSRGAIFKDRSLALAEKNQLMKFFKLVQAHLAAAAASSTESDEGAVKITEEDMETPFVEFLAKMLLPPKIKWIILYGIAMVDYDQDNVEACGDLLKTREGIARLALYITSIGRFSNAVGALIYPIYGQGELPQAFCRRAAVKGCIYVLRMPITALLLDKETGGYKGVRLATGQEIFSQKLILDPCITLGSESMSSLTDQQKETLRVLVPKSISSEAKIARGICIIRGSVKAGISNALVVYPPKSLFPEQLVAIRVLQLGSGLAVCPADMHVLYFSTVCDNDDQGKAALLSAMSTLIRPQVPENSESESVVENDNVEAKPVVLWRALYVQELVKGEFGGSISSASSPDGNLNYNELVESAVKLYEHVMGSEELFKEETSPDNATEEENDGGVEIEAM